MTRRVSYSFHFMSCSGIEHNFKISLCKFGVGDSFISKVGGGVSIWQSWCRGGCHLLVNPGGFVVLSSFKVFCSVILVRVAERVWRRGSVSPSDLVEGGAL